MFDKHQSAQLFMEIICFVFLKEMKLYVCDLHDHQKEPVGPGSQTGSRSQIRTVGVVGFGFHEIS